MHRNQVDIPLAETAEFPSLSVIIGRIIALWAFSEAALGGILHALRIPFTGLWIGGASVIFISLIAWFSEDKKVLFKATIIVIIVKGIVSPHTPLTAHLAVFIQGMLGWLIFRFIKHYASAAMILAVSTMLLSSIQKIVFTTLIFGFTLWESIDKFSLFVLKQFSLSEGEPGGFSFSAVLIGVYILLHLTGGIITGRIAARLPHRLINGLKARKNKLLEECEKNNINRLEHKKKSAVWKRRINSIIVLFAVIMLILSYVSPDLGEGTAYDVMLMLLRYALIMVCWYLILAPLLIKLIRKLFRKKRIKYAAEIEEILGLLPEMKKSFSISWCSVEKLKGLKKIKTFMTTLLVLVLLESRQ